MRLVLMELFLGKERLVVTGLLKLLQEQIHMDLEILNLFMSKLSILKSMLGVLEYYVIGVTLKPMQVEMEVSMVCSGLRVLQLPI